MEVPGSLSMSIWRQFGMYLHGLFRSLYAFWFWGWVWTCVRKNIQEILTATILEHLAHCTLWADTFYIQCSSHNQHLWDNYLWSSAICYIFVICTICVCAFMCLYVLIYVHVQYLCIYMEDLVIHVAKSQWILEQYSTDSAESHTCSHACRAYHNDSQIDYYELNK